MKKLLPLFILLCLSAFTYAAGIIKGTVTDKKNNEPLIGATISIKNKSTGEANYVSVGLDGSYIFKNLKEGSYDLEVRYISYEPLQKHAEVEDGQTVTVNFALESKSSSLNEVAITGVAGRGTDQSALNAERRS